MKSINKQRGFAEIILIGALAMGFIGYMMADNNIRHGGSYGKSSYEHQADWCERNPGKCE